MTDIVIEKLDRLEGLIIDMKEENNKRFDSIERHLDEHDKRFKEIDKRFKEIDKRFEEIDKRFKEIDKRFDGHDKKFKSICAKFLEYDVRFNRIEENMATKDDIRDIWKVLDSLVASSERHETELLCINESIRRIEIKLDEHDKILKC